MTCRRFGPFVRREAEGKRWIKIGSIFRRNRGAEYTNTHENLENITTNCCRLTSIDIFIDFSVFYLMKVINPNYAASLRLVRLMVTLFQLFSHQVAPLTLHLFTTLLHLLLLSLWVIPSSFFRSFWYDSFIWKLSILSWRTRMYNPSFFTINHQLSHLLLQFLANNFR